MAIEEYRIPPLLVYGWGALERVGEETARLGRHALLVSGRSAARSSGLLARVQQLLEAAGLAVTLYDQVEPEPSNETVDRGAALARQAGVEVVVGLGGGSPCDVARAIAGLLGLDGEHIKDYQGGKPIDRPGLPLVSIPTTSGTASEITQVAVLKDRERNLKVGMKSPYWVARVAIVDPELTLGMPPGITARTGIDALTHALEGYLSTKATVVTDATALPAIALVGRYLRRAVAKGGDREAREGMSMASLLAGMAFANCGVGAVHALVHPVGARYGVPHGVACGIFLPYVMEFNLPVRGGKMGDIANALEPGHSDGNEAPAIVRRLLSEVHLPQTLAEVGVPEEALAELVPGTMVSAALKTNPVPCGEAEVLAILRRAWKG